MAADEGGRWHVLWVAPMGNRSCDDARVRALSGPSSVQRGDRAPHSMYQ